MALTAPVSIQAGATYVASYHSNLGHYSADLDYFASAVDSAPLHAPAHSLTSNGVYRYGASAFPNQSGGGTNYWVDVVFAEASADSSGPIISRISPTAIDGTSALVTWETNEPATSKVE